MALQVISQQQSLLATCKVMLLLLLLPLLPICC
jgi:hypothetical protein